MCGVTGLWAVGPSTRESLGARVDAMSAALMHRGPDAGGRFVDANAGLALGHRRLSIVDLSAEGAQPMVSPSRRYVISYNGEIYNHRVLRAELEGRGVRFRGHSDTEVACAAFEEWGIRASIERFVGMFAFAIWDAEDREVVLVRDRLGIKPLYYARLGRGLGFASELGALERDREFDTTLDAASIASYVRVGYVAAPHAIYASAHKVLAGTILTFREPAAEPRTETFWSAEEVAARGAERPFEGSEDDATDALEAALKGSVALRLVADVPVGAFLSGGIDSSTVVALARAVSGGGKIRTYSIGSSDPAYDESNDAGRVAEYLGTEHTELRVGPADAQDALQLLPTMYDEPFGDSSQIPTYLVSRLARRDVTVALSGDGGDELFGGYNRHLWAPRLWRSARLFPRSVRRAVALGLRLVPAPSWDRLFSVAGRALPAMRLPGDKLHKMARVLASADRDELYRTLTEQWSARDSLVRSEGVARRAPLRLPGAGRGTGFAEQMMLTDLVTYLPDDILTKVDRASMAVSLEARVPILDHRVVELAFRIPVAWKIQGGVGKRILRRVLARHVPERLWDRPKMGFGLPVGAWLRGPLRAWAEGLVASDRLCAEGYLEVQRVRSLWREHLAGRGEHQHALWNVIALQAWLEARRGRIADRRAV